jgi:hypothetical protein
MSRVYRFKVALKRRTGLWRSIEIEGRQTLGDFDCAIREAFGHDTWDHLSEFWLGRVWRSEGLGEIEPGGKGEGASKRVEDLGLSEGGGLEYVYDFGDDVQHVITLERILEPEEGAEYPRVVARNKPRYRLCVECKNRGEKNHAKWVCITCCEEGREILLCDSCADKGHEDHYVVEKLY